MSRDRRFLWLAVVFFVVTLSHVMAQSTATTEADQLRRSLAQADARDLTAEIQLANCVAEAQGLQHRLESGAFSSRVDALLARYRTLFPDDQWRWNPTANQIEIVPKETP